MAIDDDSDNGGRRRPAKRRQMTADERALAGLERRRAERRDYPGVVAPDDPFSSDEITEPERVLGRDPTDVELEILRRLGIPSDQPVTMRDLAKILSRDYRRDVEHSSGTKELGRQMEELRKILQTPPNSVTAELSDRVEDLERDAKAARIGAKKLKGVAWTAVIAAVGSIGTAAVKLYDRAKEDGETEIRLKLVERNIDKLERQVDRLILPDRHSPKDIP